jgi:peptide/nickel transport system permease protein
MIEFELARSRMANARERAAGKHVQTSLTVGLASLGLLILLVIFGPLAIPNGPGDQDLDSRLLPPSSAHWLGTDNFGRDVFTRILYAGRADLQIGVFTTFFTFVFGSAVGVLSGFYGGYLDAVVMRLLDIFLAFPTLVLVIAVVAIMGPGFLSLYVALSLAGWLPYARLARGEILAAKQMEYVIAARALGCGDWQLIWRHLLPNAISSAIVFAASAISFNILAAASLSYLGLGVRSPGVEWGAMIAEGRVFFLTTPGLILYPSLALAITGLIFSLIGDGLADALRPGRSSHGGWDQHERS